MGSLSGPHWLYCDQANEWWLVHPNPSASGIPERAGVDWEAVAQDYGGPGDHRYCYGPSREAMPAKIEEVVEDNIDRCYTRAQQELWCRRRGERPWWEEASHG